MRTVDSNIEHISADQKEKLDTFVIREKQKIGLRHGIDCFKVVLSPHLKVLMDTNGSKIKPFNRESQPHSLRSHVLRAV